MVFMISEKFASVDFLMRKKLFPEILYSRKLVMNEQNDILLARNKKIEAVVVIAPISCLTCYDLFTSIRITVQTQAPYVSIFRSLEAPRII